MTGPSLHLRPHHHQLPAEYHRRRHHHLRPISIKNTFRLTEHQLTENKHQLQTNIKKTVSLGD